MKMGEENFHSFFQGDVLIVGISLVNGQSPTRSPRVRVSVSALALFATPVVQQGLVRTDASRDG